MINNDIFNVAVDRIKSGICTFVVIKKGKIIKEASGIGVKPILQLLDNEPHTLKDASICDKIIGKAASMLLILGGVEYIHGEIMSVSGRDFLLKHNIPHNCEILVNHINNRKNDGICPLEKAVTNIYEVQEGYKAIKDAIVALMEKKVEQT
jgi:hypothetical protein